MASHRAGHSGSTFSSQDKVRAQQANQLATSKKLPGVGSCIECFTVASLCCFRATCIRNWHWSAIFGERPRACLESNDLDSGAALQPAAVSARSEGGALPLGTDPQPGIRRVLRPPCAESPAGRSCLVHAV